MPAQKLNIQKQLEMFDRVGRRELTVTQALLEYDISKATCYKYLGERELKLPPSAYRTAKMMILQVESGKLKPMELATYLERFIKYEQHLTEKETMKDVELPEIIIETGTENDSTKHD